MCHKQQGTTSALQLSHGAAGKSHPCSIRAPPARHPQRPAQPVSPAGLRPRWALPPPARPCAQDRRTGSAPGDSLILLLLCPLNATHGRAQRDPAEAAAWQRPVRERPCWGPAGLGAALSPMLVFIVSRTGPPRPGGRSPRRLLAAALLEDALDGPASRRGGRHRGRLHRRPLPAAAAASSRPRPAARHNRRREERGRGPRPTARRGRAPWRPADRQTLGCCAPARPRSAQARLPALCAQDLCPRAGAARAHLRGLCGRVGVSEACACGAPVHTRAACCPRAVSRGPREVRARGFRRSGRCPEPTRAPPRVCGTSCRCAGCWWRGPVGSAGRRLRRGGVLHPAERPAPGTARVTAQRRRLACPVSSSPPEDAGGVFDLRVTGATALGSKSFEG